VSSSGVHHTRNTTKPLIRRGQIIIIIIRTQLQDKMCTACYQEASEITVLGREFGSSYKYVKNEKKATLVMGYRVMKL
jgi:hypothetical protein